MKKKTSRDIWNSGGWSVRRRKHRKYAKRYDGAHLKETIGRRNRETGDKVRKFPLDINLTRLACDIHRDVARGIPVRDQPLVVRSVVERTEAIGESAKVLEDIINNGLWRPSHGGTLQQEAMLEMNIHGGAVFKLSWEPWNFDLPYRLAVRLLKNPGFIKPVWDRLDPWRMLECYIGYEISPQEARLKYGVKAPDNSPPLLYMEYWSRNEFRITVERAPGEDVVPVMKQGANEWPLEGENPWGVVPVYYIPHERTTNLFGNSEVEGQEELEKEFNSRAANISDLVRATRPGMLWGHDLAGTLTVKEIKKDGVTIGLVIDAGRTRNVQGGQPPTLDAMPTSDIPETIAEFPQTLLEFWMMVKRIAPAVFGMDDTSSGRITGPATTNRMWTSIAHSLTERSNFSTGKTLLDKDALRILAIQVEQDVYKELELDPPAVEKKHSTSARIKQVWPPMVPMDRKDRHTEWIERLREGGASIEMYLEEMGVADSVAAREEIIRWITDVTKAKTETVDDGDTDQDSDSDQ
ncbi:MAG: hypothetical protein GY832_15425 [Chloroflexi bacterium]|nr:hypothetical protein [Chloroflexota bacterium]